MAKKKLKAKPAAKKSAAKKAAKPAAKQAKASAKAPKKAAPKKAAPKKAAAPKKTAAKSKAAPKVSAKSSGKSAGKTSAPAKVAKAPAKFRVGQPLESVFTPLDDRLIVEKEADATRTAGGLFIPDTVGATDRPKQGKVVAVGRGHRSKKGRIRPLDVQLGDTVLFEAYVGSEMKIGDRELVVLRESEVLGIVK